NAISGDLKDGIHQLTGRTVKDEKGIEVFYDFALTPAIRLIPSYQHVWNPFVAGVAQSESHADVFMARVTVAF
ncbi:MAG TPA: carbohydrate porin, partial [Gemmataceae bacterium]|nr:carbohydrate porin [Gemmataceae bacterium]